MGEERECSGSSEPGGKLISVNNGLRQKAPLYQSVKSKGRGEVRNRKISHR